MWRKISMYIDDQRRSLNDALFHTFQALTKQFTCPLCRTIGWGWQRWRRFVLGIRCLVGSHRCNASIDGRGSASCSCTVTIVQTRLELNEEVQWKKSNLSTYFSIELILKETNFYEEKKKQRIRTCPVVIGVATRPHCCRIWVRCWA